MNTFSIWAAALTSVILIAIAVVTIAIKRHQTATQGSSPHVKTAFLERLRDQGSVSSGKPGLDG